jgi:cobalamin-dependent methionine synthase I
MSVTKIKIIGELMNHSFGRARRSWIEQDVKGYIELARIQARMGASFLTLNLDGTQALQVRQAEMVAFLPDLVPAIQAEVSLPISFDNPWLGYHQVALQHYDPSISGPPIINSVAASRKELDAMIALVAEFDAWVIVMASEKFISGGTAQCLSAQDAYDATRQFVNMLRKRAGRRNEQIIIDPGLAPVGADTYGLVNNGLDVMRMIRQDPDLEGVHICVGLTNFSWGTPKELRVPLERAYLTLASEAGLDMALANPEKNPQPLEVDHPLVAQLRQALEKGRPENGETQEHAGYRQAEGIMEICANVLTD